MTEVAHGKRQQRTRTTWAVAISALGGAVLLWRAVATSSEGIDLSARRYFEAIQTCDGSTLLSMTFQEELEGNAWTPGKMSEVCRLLIQPTLTEFSTRPTIDVTVDDQPSGLVSYAGANAHGDVLRWTVQVYKTPTGPKSTFLRNVFNMAYARESSARNSGKFDRALYQRAFLRCVDHYGDKLAALGIQKGGTVNIKTGRVDLWAVQERANQFRPPSGE